jgi:hypothetical protein
MKKANLLAQLKRCEAIILQEVTTLDSWANDPRITAGREANCHLSIREISFGSSCALEVVRSIIEVANALAEADVTRSPSKHSKDLVDHLKDDSHARAQLDGPVLVDGLFDLTLSRAEHNAIDASDAASGIEEECTA